MKDKSGFFASLKILDEGNLTFPREELIPFLRSDELVFCFVFVFPQTKKLFQACIPLFHLPALPA